MPLNNKTLRNTTIVLESWMIEDAKIRKINLSGLIRELYKAYSDNPCGDAKARLADIQKQRDFLNAQEYALKSNIIQQEKAEQDGQLDIERREYLKNSPDNPIRMFQTQSISYKGWQKLMTDLKFSTKKKCIEFIQNYVEETKNQPAAVYKQCFGKYKMSKECKTCQENQPCQTTSAG